MQKHADKLLTASIGTRTQNVYEKHISEYLEFSKNHRQERFKNDSLSQYIAKLHLDGLTVSTITSRISALKFHCKRKNLHADLESVHVKAMLKGARNLECSQSSKCKDGCTVTQLERIVDLAHILYSKYEATMLASMFSLAFFGFLRVSEYSFTSAGHTINFHGIELTRQGLKIAIPSSKFSRKETSICLNAFSESPKICPVKCFRSYKKLRPKTASSLLYLLSDNKPLSASGASNYLRKLTDATNYTGITTHSFRIGGATWAAQQGWSDASIRAHGRWQSNAFIQYVRPT